MKNNTATFSPCRRYRYDLWRRWNYQSRLTEDGPLPRRGGYVLFIGLNPSTADETKDDATIRRCVGYAKHWGFGALCMANLFAFRATDPRVMKREADPVGASNDITLCRLAAQAGQIICAWGVHGAHRNRQADVRALLYDSRLHCLGQNADGSPKHPLYLGHYIPPTLFHSPDLAGAYRSRYS